MSPNAKKEGFLHKSNCLLSLEFTEMHRCCVMQIIFFQLDNFYETTIIVATGMIKRTDLENCRDKSDVIYGNWWLYDQSPNLTASCPVLKPMKKFPLFFLIEKVVGEEELKQLDEKYVPSYFFSLVGRAANADVSSVIAIFPGKIHFQEIVLQRYQAKRCDHQMMQFSSHYLTS